MSGEYFELPQIEPTASDELLIIRGLEGKRANVGNLGALFSSLNSDSPTATTVRESHPSGENGGFFPPQIWYTRPLNHLSGTGSLVDGAVFLPEGNYLFFGYGIAMQIRSHQTRLLSSSGQLIVGSSAYSAHANTSVSFVGPGIISINDGDSLRLQHQCSRNLSKSWGLGYRTNFGQEEVYASLFFLKV